MEILERSSSKRTARKIQDETVDNRETTTTSHLAKKFAFTLAEVMITLAIIGVVAAITIPGVIVNSQQTEYKTGFRKAVSVLNQAINAMKAMDGTTPYDTPFLYGSLKKTMNTMRGMTTAFTFSKGANFVLYTTDGIRYEFPAESTGGYSFLLHEAGTTETNGYFLEPTFRSSWINNIKQTDMSDMIGTGYCGSYGLNYNPDQTSMPPCIVIVDVNGDRKPSPTKAVSISDTDYNSSVAEAALDWMKENYDKTNTKIETYAFSDTAKSLYKVPDVNGILLTDVFAVMITDRSAVPYGVVAQKAMYQAQK